MQEQFGASVTLVRGSRGAFEIELEGALIFSKLKEGRFPTHDEVDALIAVASPT